MIVHKSAVQTDKSVQINICNTSSGVDSGLAYKYFQACSALCTISSCRQESTHSMRGVCYECVTPSVTVQQTSYKVINV